MKLESRRIGIGDLEAVDREAMFQLFRRYFAFADRHDFESDLAQKDWVIQLFNVESGRLCGFSSQVLITACFDDQHFRALFSGDTIVDLECRSETALIREWGRLALEQAQLTSPEPLYWFLISKGYKTYRFLPVFFREFYPRFDVETPVAAARLIDGFGQQLFGEHFDPHRGLLVAWPTKNRLLARYAGVPAHRTQDPHVRFFLERNPDYRAGDELCCLARIDPDNFTPAGWRLIDHIRGTCVIDPEGSRKVG